jgi:uncharacterized protein with NAD-binding domain and iron-sulfur cluster
MPAAASGTQPPLGPRVKVAVIGGGCGGVAAAFWMSSTPDLRARYQVTLWTRGWRLGGKGASGRDAEAGQRIEEHGLHLWLGFYNNAFTTMRAAFAALPANSGTFRGVEEAFAPVYDTVFMQREGAGRRFSPWHVHFPPLPGKPGDFLPKPSPFTALVAWLKMILGPQLPADVANIWDAKLAPSEQLAKTHKGATAPAGPTPMEADAVLVAQARDGVRQLQAAVAKASADPNSFDVYCFLILADLGLAVLGGYLIDLLPYGFSRAAYDKLDALDFRAWLKLRGASEDSLNSGPLQGVYDLAFAYPRGDAIVPRKGAMAAGVTLRLMESLVFGYRDAPIFRMKAGMGDTIFTPLYDALVEQGVTVNFFHALEDVRPSADGKSIAALELRRQADLVQSPYRPFVTVKGLRCWPSDPDWSQLVDGDKLKSQHVNFEWTNDRTSAGSVELLAGRDFEAVLLAMPPEALKVTTPKLRSNEKWSEMLDNSASVATIAAQLWLKSDSAGFRFPVQPPPPVTAYAEPLATWADMSHLLCAEDWPAPAPQSIAYFCGPMVKTHPGVDPTQAAKAATEAWLAANIRGLWPSAPPNGNLDPQLVSAYFRANVDPSERYVQAPPGSLVHRLSPDSRPFDNLYLAGDWTKLPVSGGCVETAIQSAMVAARAITGADIPIDEH